MCRNPEATSPRSEKNAAGAGAARRGLFGVVHGCGLAGGSPAPAARLLCGAGLSTAAMALQLAGIGMGLLARRAIGQRVLPIGASAIAGIGITLVLAL